MSATSSGLSGSFDIFREQVNERKEEGGGGSRAGCEQKELR
jgi:hypothetical protein